ncbi:AT hook motif DNA-binding family protein [Arabidopsis thaliana]|uniref:AT-hook motif nuclear-localized protein 7 n=1 Tax=Arabidopsis thaliana TaxID=3702 RepID=AHL7_ARATH|nr:AT hook motif DNA-binding family protein [Arabidopsis thaliana]NP_191931.2 AT hook motif DNA-binding family protein [Arabidopsis thaliana]Q4V3E0.1 RecName: Full=AT-hook motif nuclear-localized protein 7 [Arabidopsis thaliana]AAY56407.1 At4g00200 [Arabidopsis thaliana]AEE81837.1 AT hook motif DNA-binding family protein [Arabidopsis thaliana]ANM67819.1 AT hook motif DNA-binding family protein [Arabidopsis thaliana]BAF00540.1 putative transcription factor [Arabidopsis thaliana]|eukprot:NP_001329621.1 AT hook motif DNA-binding family protein [Arabidopsis thaliana]
METSDRISPGGGIGAEVPSAYHMAPRPSDSPANQFMGLSLPPMEAPMPSSGEASGKKRRGRPRKYEANGAPLPSSSVPLVKKRVRGKLNGFDMKKMHKTIGFHSSGERFGVGGGVGGGVGSNFTPHVITVNTGEDITMRIISFSQQGPRAICILSANGVISNVTLRQPDSCGGTLTYEGRFEILSLSGSFMETENQGSKGRSGGMSVSLAGPDGRVVGGGVAGLLIAATPIQVVVGSFITSDQQDHQKPRKQRVEHAPAAVMSVPPPPSPPPPAASVFSPTNPDREQPPSSFGISSWTNGQDMPRNSATDINISLPVD